METTNEISRNLRVVFWEKFMDPEMIIGEKFPTFGKIFTPACENTGLFNPPESWDPFVCSLRKSNNIGVNSEIKPCLISV